MMDRINDLTPDLFPLAHALNERFAVEMSSVSFEAFVELIGKAAIARAAARLDGFLIAIDLGAAVDGENFLWFKANYEDLLYLDRIAVDPDAQGRGVARRLYADLFRWAAANGYKAVGAEINVRPPNPASDALHRSLGFREVAQRDLMNGKRVRYLVKDLE